VNASSAQIDTLAAEMLKEEISMSRLGEMADVISRRDARPVRGTASRRTYGFPVKRLHVTSPDTRPDAASVINPNEGTSPLRRASDTC
jgi:hypothetical protein